MESELGSEPFLDLGATAASERDRVQSDLRAGVVSVRRLGSQQETTIPGGLVHHWVGTVFIPGATLEQTIAVAQDYDRHAEYYAPEVVRSRTLRKDGDRFEIYLRFRRAKLLTVVFDTEHKVRYFRLDGSRAWSRSESTRVVELEDAGTPQERARSSEESWGLLWRLHSWWRYREADGGTYAQLETVSLTRDIPTGLGWLVHPFLESVPREALETSLRKLRRAVRILSTVSTGEPPRKPRM